MDETLRFGRFELQPLERRLLADGEPVALGARAFDLLLALAEGAGRLVGKQELLDRVWPGRVVQENNLPAQMSALRRALGEGVIATIPGRGYRFVAPLRVTTGGGGRSAPEAVAASAAMAWPSRLPALLPELIGRDDELAALAAAADASRLVTVVGSGGIGKSLLVQHLLRGRGGRHAHGVCWAELVSATPHTLAGTVAAALGISGAGADPLEMLRRALAPLDLLLALDSAEPLLDEVARLCDTLLEAAPGLRLVVTSQAPLRLAAETVLRLGPLAVPDEAESAATATAHGAVQLFLRRARALDVRFTVDDAGLAAVAAICRALDGVPLAIELAAARAPSLGVQALRDAMQDRLHLLTRSGNRVAPPRQQTLRSALEWSLSGLQPLQRTVFRRLAVVAGSASLELALQVVCDSDEGGAVDRWAALDALDALVDWSLLAVAGGGAGDALRYRLPESPRALALEELDDDEGRPARRRHALGLAAAFAAALDRYHGDSGGAEAWMAALAADLDNARAALRWARAAGDAETELRLGATLLRALPPSLLGERLALAEACCERLAGADALPLALRVRAWIEVSAALGNGRRDESHAAASAAVALLARADAEGLDPFLRYHAGCQLACAAAMTGRLDEADRALAAARAIEDPRWPAERLIWGAEAAQFTSHVRGDDAGALEQARRAAELDRRRGNDASIVGANLVYLELHAGQVQAAVERGLALVAALQGTRHVFTLALVRLNLLSALVTAGDAPRSREVAAALWPQLLFFDWAYYAFGYLAQLAALEGRPRAAAMLLGRSEALARERPQERPAPTRLAAEARAKEAAVAALGAEGFGRAAALGAGLSPAALHGIVFSAADA